MIAVEGISNACHEDRTKWCSARPLSWTPMFKPISEQPPQRPPIHKPSSGTKFYLANVNENHEAQNNSLLELAA